MNAKCCGCENFFSFCSLFTSSPPHSSPGQFSLPSLPLTPVAHSTAALSEGFITGRTMYSGGDRGGRGGRGGGRGRGGGGEIVAHRPIDPLFILFVHLLKHLMGPRSLRQRRWARRRRRRRTKLGRSRMAERQARGDACGRRRWREESRGPGP